MGSLKNLVRPAIQALVPFASARSQTAGGESLVYLDANESPYTVDQRQYNRYPEPQSSALLELFSELYGAKTSQILISLGSETGIDHIIRTFCEARQDAIMISTPTFAMYEIWAAIQGVEIIRVPLRKDDLQLDMAGIRSSMKSNCKVLFLCTPNNPMGSLLKREDILMLCSELKDRCIVVVDEAYLEFTDEPSLIADLAVHENLMILRTLSKAFGLAAARCAAVIGKEELIGYVRKVMASYPFPQPSADIVLAAMTPEKRKERLKEVQILKAERDRLAVALKKSPLIRKVYPSATNFLLLDVVDVDAFMTRLREKGTIARDRRVDWPNAVRLTMGTPQENDQVLRALT
jgi:histidinol-phosphate aminotransferase